MNELSRICLRTGLGLLLLLSINYQLLLFLLPSVNTTMNVVQTFAMVRINF